MARNMQSTFLYSLHVGFNHPVLYSFCVDVRGRGDQHETLNPKPLSP